MTRASTATETSATTPPRHVEANGVTFAYFGPRERTPVVFLHNFTATIDDRDPRVLDSTAAERRVITVDNRGVAGPRPDADHRRSHG